MTYLSYFFSMTVLLVSLFTYIDNAFAEMAVVWSKSFPHNTSSGEWFNKSPSITVDNQENLIVLGNASTLSDIGGEDVLDCDGSTFLAKFNRDGSHVWSKEFCTIVADLGVANDGSIYITGAFANTVDFDGHSFNATSQSDIFLVKYDNNGNYLWAKTFSDFQGPIVCGDYACDNGVKSVSVDSDGNIIILGIIVNPISFGGEILPVDGWYDIFVAKFNSSGNHMWSRTFGGNDARVDPYDIAIDRNDNIYITGYYNGTSLIGDVENVTITDAFLLLKINSNGEYLWHRNQTHLVPFAGNWSKGVTLATDDSGNVVVVGDFAVGLRGVPITFGGDELSSSQGFFLVKYDSNGEHIWSTASSGYISGNKQISIDRNNDIFLAGHTEGTQIIENVSLVSSSYSDLFFAKFRSNGTLVYSDIFGGLEEYNYGRDDHLYDILADSHGHIFVSGSFYYTMDIWGDALVSPEDGPSMFLIKAYDSDSDIEETLESVIEILQMLSGKSQDIFSSNYDFTGNGVVGLEDAIKVLHNITFE